jgi:hypothetical protein
VGATTSAVCLMDAVSGFPSGKSASIRAGMPRAAKLASRWLRSLKRGTSDLVYAILSWPPTRAVLEADIFIDGVFGLGHSNCGDFLGFALRKEPNPLILKSWLGGLDSNQDSQIQNLESCQLDDLPTG